ncbi:MAG: RnfH family protein [Gammaproteobacteria bacterium]
MGGVELIDVEVAYVGSAQVCMPLQVPYGTTIRGAIERSRLSERCPEIDLEHWRVGVHGTLRAPDSPVQAGDRVEIYRPLRCDPKAARRRRATRGAQSASGSDGSR